MIVCGKSVKGPYRENNEDFLGFKRSGEYLILALSDGIGGAPCGEEAAKLAVDTSLAYISELLDNDTPDGKIDQILDDAYNFANKTIVKTGFSDINKLGMGATLVVCVIKDSRIKIANLGDSRAYIVHGSNITRVTKDHNLAEELVRMGKISEIEAQTNPGKNQLLKYLGENRFISPDIYSYNIIYGDYIFLCSDGLYSFVSKEDMTEAFRKDRSRLDALVTNLIDKALESGSKDNITLIAANVKPGEVIGEIL